ncbi:MAG: metallophosphoesterase [Verrucomicrobia bacterium]|nr:metallophosphoesterase [Verrucomicrobiota bacterium]
MWVAGNHEFYHQSVPSMLDQFLVACRDTNIHFLENEAVAIGGYTFVGCTLWTDFRLLGDDQQVDAWAQAAALITDFRRIRLEPDDRLMRSTDTILWHETSRRWLAGEMAGRDPRHTIVVTHHAPSARSLPGWQSRQLLSSAFASNLDALVERSRARLWVHGHTHHCTRYQIGETVIIANSRGYPKEIDPAFVPGLVIEI